MRVIFVVAARNLVQAIRRSLLVSLAIALVTMVSIILLGFSAGAQRSFVDSVGALTSGHVNVGGFFKSSSDSAQALILDRKQVLETVERQTPGFVRAVDRQRTVVSAFSMTNSLRGIVLTGINAEDEAALLEFLVDATADDSNLGEGPSEFGAVGAPGNAIIFASQAERLGIGIGDTITVRADTETLGPNALDLNVVAIAKNVGMLSRWIVFTSRASVQELEGFQSDTTGVVQVYIEEPDRAQHAMGSLRDALEEDDHRIMDHAAMPYYWKFSGVKNEDWTGQKLDLTTWRDEVSYITWILNALDAISVSLLVVLLALVVIGILNVMMMAVRERTQEVGTLRAIGMSRRDVVLMILIEATILGLGATVFGAVMAVGLTVGVNAAEIQFPIAQLSEVILSDTVYLHLVPFQVFVVIVMLTALTVLASVWPAIRAARLKPVTAIQEVH